EKALLDRMLALEAVGGRRIGKAALELEDRPDGTCELKHAGGGCRIAADPSTGVCDPFGRTFDHENLFVVGSPNVVSGGCAHPTLTFVALALRSARHIAAGFA